MYVYIYIYIYISCTTDMTNAIVTTDITRS